jgi:hypothetical protein
MAVGATTASLQSATDDDGNALPAGRYFFAIDGDNSSKEHISSDLSGTSLTNIKTVSRQGVEAAGCVRAHRVGASVALTTFAHIKFINDLVKGTTDLDASDPLKYDATATINNDNHLATKAYVDGVAIAGAPDSSSTVKGITKLSVAAADPATPIAVGDNDPRVPTTDENNALAATTTPSASNKFVTQKDYQLAAVVYAADSVGTDAYAVTLSPAPGACAAGMTLRFKAGTANTGAATLNVNALGAITIKKRYNQDLATGDILANQIVEVVYDGTNFQLVSPTASTPDAFKAISAVRALDAATGSVTYAHGMGVTPRRIKITAFGTSGNGAIFHSIGTYDGSTYAGIRANYDEASEAIDENFTDKIVYIGSGSDPSVTGQSATVSALDATNITLAWTKLSSPGAEAVRMLIEATA